MRNYKDRSSQNVTSEFLGTHQILSEPQETKLLIRSSSPHPQSCSSSPILYRPSPQVTQAKTAAGINSSLYDHQYLIPTNFSWLNFTPFHTSCYSVSCHHCFSRLQQPNQLSLLLVSPFPKSILHTAPILYPIFNPIPTITIC